MARHGGESEGTGSDEHRGVEADEGYSSVDAASLPPAEPGSVREAIHAALAKTKGVEDTESESDDAPEDQTADAPSDADPDEEGTQDAAESAPSEKKESPYFAPSSWTAEAKEKFYALPEELQAEVVRRETDNRRQLSRLGEEAKQARQFVAELEEVIEPFKGRWAVEGTDAKSFLKQAIAWDEAFRYDAPTAIAAVAEAYGVNLQQLLGAAQQQPQAQQAQGLPPDVARELMSLRSEVAALKGVSQDSVRQQVEQSIGKWASETDEAGNPKRPYLELVQDQMESYAQVLLEKNPNLDISTLLGKAYKLACEDSEDVRIREKARQAKKSITDASRRVQAAKSSAVGLDAESPGEAPERPPEDRTALIRWNARRLGLLS